MMGLFIDKDLALWGIVMLIGMIISHLALMYIGTVEPHLGTLLTTFHLTKISARTIGRRSTKNFRAE